MTWAPDPVRFPAAVAGCVLLALSAAAAEQGGLFGLGRELGGKGPVTVTAKTLEYDYRNNVVTYRGDVEAAQGEVRLRSDELTVRLVGTRPGGGGRAAEGSDGDPGGSGDKMTLREVVAIGHVRIDQGTRWATGGRAVFDQDKRIFLLTDHPVLHDGPNEVAGDRVVVYLDEDRSVVEGGQRRVKAVLYPDDRGGALGAAPR
jgi:lipopolysaccharide export system protein LptA